jgi:acyl-coenzyme A thioesterase 9
LLSGTAHVSSIVSSARTGITAKLWQMRYEMQKFKNNATELQTKTVTKAPKDSFLKVDLPVASDPQVRDNYLNFRGGIRFGKLLEDIDAFAGNIAFMHCNDGDPNTKVPVLVTACLDRLDLKSPVTLSLGSDLELQGQVNWTSKSSVQIGINLMVKGDCGGASGSPQDANLMTASMVFVHVQKGKAAPVNQIRPETESDRHLFAQGVAAEEMRKIDRANNLELTAPTQEESEKLHHAMISGFGPAAVPLAATKMEAVQLMQPQERNRWEPARSNGTKLSNVRY